MWKIIFIIVLARAGATGAPATAASGPGSAQAIKHNLINEMNETFSDLEQASEKFIDLGTFIGKHKVPPKTVKITKTIAVKVPVPFPVKVPHPVPVPVPVPKAVPVPVVKPVLVPVTKLVRVPEASVVTPTASTAPSSPEPTENTRSTIAALSNRSYGIGKGNSDLNSEEQETSQSNRHEQVHEFTKSYPIHSVFDAGVDYNPYAGNRLAISKQKASSSEHRPTRHYMPDYEKVQEYSKYPGRHQEYRGYRSGLKTEVAHEHYSTAQPDIEHSAENYDGPHADIVPNSYKHPKSYYYAKETEKYPTPKFPRPTHSAFPTTPIYRTKDTSYESDNHYEGQSLREYHHKPSPTAPSYQSVSDSYPHYERPDFKKYHYVKPSASSYREHVAEEPQHKEQHHKKYKYVYYYPKPTEEIYIGSDPDEESSSDLKQYHHHSESHKHEVEHVPVVHHKSPSHYEVEELYARPSATPETYAHHEPKESHYPRHKFKVVYPRPTPVSQALTYLEDKEPAHSEHKEYYPHYQEHRHSVPKETKIRYVPKVNHVPYEFPSDSHLHPSYAEESSSSKHKMHHYYSQQAEQTSQEETHEPEHKYFIQHHLQHHRPSPSPSPTTAYGHDHAESNEPYEYHQHRPSKYYTHSLGHHHHSAPSSPAVDMLESSSKGNEAYEQAVEQKLRSTYANNPYVEYSHEHVHHDHVDRRSSQSANPPQSQ
ncbi:adhesive plaque matrix protein-like [Uranotaenia lowii]|uniref:adhesive plaque matrix protein-like n=1 Tax=Uranotaenia lowii TaxID=190385 RepID=UPI00247A245E|nr:adhesive plaque matrix protein-like [Uranotaenia lowii]